MGLGCALLFCEVDGGVVEVVLGVFEDHGAVLVAKGAADLSGDSGDEGVGGDDGLLGDDGTGGDDGAFADAGVVEDGGTDADEDGVLEDAAVDGGVVADGDHLADDDGIEVAHAVEDGAVLDVAFGPDADGVDVAADDGVHPDAGVFAEDDVANDLCGGIDVAGWWDYGGFSLISANHAEILRWGEVVGRV